MSGISIDLFGLESWISALEDVRDGLPTMDKEFIQDEFNVFLDKVIPHTPVDTGDMLNAYAISDVRQNETITEADYSNEMPYSSFVNFGTVFIEPRYFWQKGMTEAEQGREKRYQDKLKSKFDNTQ